MDRRDPARSLTRLALTDGERALQIRVNGKLHVTLTLDLMHVLEKLWKAAYVFHPEGSLDADLWVIDRALRILYGEVSQVVKGIRQSITKRGLSGPKRKTLNGIANYLYRNRIHMHYHEYLANGWPIASGPVEGACKNLINLSGHLKTGHRGSLQNRPTGRSQDLRLLYRIWGRRGKGFCGVGRAGVATRPGPSFLTRFLELPGPTNGRP